MYRPDHTNKKYSILALDPSHVNALCRFSNFLLNDIHHAWLGDHALIFQLISLTCYNLAHDAVHDLATTCLG